MKVNNVIIKIVAAFMMAFVISIYPSGCVYASRDEVLDLEEEKSDIEDKIEERRAQGKSYDDLEERRNDVQDEIDNIKDEG